MNEIYIYMVKLPDGINEYVTPCLCGYTIYIDINLTHEQAIKAYEHAMKHIINDDFSKEDVQMIETEAHS